MWITDHAITRYQERIRREPAVTAHVVLLVYALLDRRRSGKKTAFIKAKSNFWLVASKRRIVTVVKHPRLSKRKASTAQP